MKNLCFILFSFNNVVLADNGVSTGNSSKLDDHFEFEVISDNGLIEVYTSNETDDNLNMSPQAVGGGIISCGIGINRGQVCN